MDDNISDLLIKCLNELNLGAGSLVSQCVSHIQNIHHNITTHYINIVINQELSNHNIVCPFGKNDQDSNNDYLICVASVVEPILCAANYRTFQQTKFVIDRIVKTAICTPGVPRDYYYYMHQNYINRMIELGYLLCDNKGFIKVSPTVRFGYYS